MTGTPFSTAIIPLGDAVEYAMLCKTCEFRGLACAFQRAGEHTFRVKTFGEGLAHSRPSIHSLLPAYLSQRDVRSPGMLPGFTPKSLTMSQQYQEPRLAARCINSHSAVHVLFAHASTLVCTAWQLHRTSHLLRLD